MKLIKCVFALAILSTLTVGAVAQDVDQAASGVVYVTVIGNTQISGVVEGLEAIKLNTSFGDIQIPLGKIDGVKMNADGKSGAVVAFSNGDIVTGNLALQKVTVRTDWGKAHINTNAIQTMMSSKNSRFVSDGSGSGGWRFNRAQPNRNQNRQPRAGQPRPAQQPFRGN